MTQTFTRAALIGHPVSHSKSPLIHNHWIAQHSLSGEYTAIDIAPENLKEGVQKLIDAGYAGFNVTLPHKQDIFKLCAQVDDKAKTIGAVNTVVIQDGKLYGTNTDAFGFIENIKKSLIGFDFGGGPIVVLGAGGAARAILFGLIVAGAKEIIITNRTKEKADELCAMNKDIIRSVPWDERSNILANAVMLINTTALGMTGKSPLEIDLSMLPKNAVVTDIVYAPLMTPLLTAAKERGNPVVTGIGMLLHQARPAFEKFFGVLPEVDATLERKVLS